MASENIGTIKCLVCGELVPVTQQKNSLAMFHCQWCGCQMYCRGLHADKKLREKMSAPAPAPEPEPAPKKVVEPPEPKKEPKLEPPKKERTRSVFGV